MPVIIGYFIGKMIAYMIIAIMKLLFQLVRIALIVAGFVFKYTFLAIEMVSIKLWQGGKGLYEQCRM